MANARVVETAHISGKARKKTSVFWSTVPENEQFKNVKVPGVTLNRFNDVKKDKETTKHVQVVQKSKSDSAILNKRIDPITVNKLGKLGNKSAGKQNCLLDQKKDVPNGTGSNEQLPNVSSLSESSKARRASLKNLNIEDKKRVANLIKELAKTGEERELALERLQEERISFEEQLSAVQDEQMALKQERKALKQRLEKSDKLLKKYENELKDVKTEKDKQELAINNRFRSVQPQSTQTSPVVQALEEKTRRGNTGRKTTNTQAYDVDEAKVNKSSTQGGRMRWRVPQIPVYSNSLFDVKMSSADDYEQNSDAQSTSGEFRPSLMESGSLHEIYLREYSLQLRLQEHQIEIQRQQVQLQQQFQLLQQQQQQHQQRYQESRQDRQEQQHGRPRDKPYQQQQQSQEQQHEYRRHEKPERQKKNNQQAVNAEQPQNQPQNWCRQERTGREMNEAIFPPISPKQQTNLLQKPTPEQTGVSSRTSQSIQPAAGTIPHVVSYRQHVLEDPEGRQHGEVQNTNRLPSRRHYHDTEDHLTTTQYHQREKEQDDKRQTKDRSYSPSSSLSSPPSHQDYNHSGYGINKTGYFEHQSGQPDEHRLHTTPSVSPSHSHEPRKRDLGNPIYQNSKDKQEANSARYQGEIRHKSQSPRMHHPPEKIHIQDDWRFQPNYHTGYDVNGNLVQVYSRQKSYSDGESDFGGHNVTSEELRHCVYYDHQTGEQEVYDMPMVKHDRQQSFNQRIPEYYNIREKAPPRHGSLPPHMYHQTRMDQHLPYRTEMYPNDTNHTRVPGKTGYHQLPDAFNGGLHFEPHNYETGHHQHSHRNDRRQKEGVVYGHAVSPTRNQVRQNEYDSLPFDDRQHSKPLAVIHQTLPEARNRQQEEYSRHQSGSPPKPTQSSPHVSKPEYKSLSDSLHHSRHEAVYQPSQKMDNKHEHTGTLFYGRHQFPAKRFPQNENVDYGTSERKLLARPHGIKNKSNDSLLDDYIYTHQTFGQYNVKATEQLDKSNKISTKRKISRKGEDEKRVERFQEERNRQLATTGRTQNEDHENPNPGYSLYNQNAPHPINDRLESPRAFQGENPSEDSHSYPNSLVEIVEDLEVSSSCEERYSGDNDVILSEKQSYDSFDEESSVLDNIFFLKR